MPALTTLTVDDGAVTPVSHSFVPVGTDSNGVSRFREAGTTAVGDSIISVSLRDSSSDSKVKARITLSRPVVVTETINGVDEAKLSRIAFADLNFSFDRKSTKQERDDQITLLRNLLAETNVVAVLEDREHFY